MANIVYYDQYPIPYHPRRTVLEHRKIGKLRFELSDISLYLSEKQAKVGQVWGNELRKEMADQSALNASYLDFFLKNTHLIPDDWKGKRIFFWGTIYNEHQGDFQFLIPCVRYLIWKDDKWEADDKSISGGYFDENCLAAVFLPNDSRY